MIKFYQFLANLSGFQVFFISTLLLSFMIVLPYSGIIFKVLRLMIFRENLEIINFEILQSPVFSIKDSIVAGAEPDSIISGSKALLVWKVKGASRLDIDPIGKNIKGNSAEVIITAENCVFTLTAHGLNGKLNSQISIPTDSIKILHTEKISENQELSKNKIYPHTNKLNSSVSGYEPNTVQNYSLVLKKIKNPANATITGSHKKVSAAFKMNYSLHKYNQIFNKPK